MEVNSCKSTQFKVLSVIRVDYSTCLKQTEKQHWEVIRKQSHMSEGLEPPAAEPSEDGVNLFRGTERSMSPGVNVPRHLEGSAHSSLSVERWDDAQPTVRYLTWPISRRPGARAPAPLCCSCPGLGHPETHEHHFCPQWGRRECASVSLALKLCSFIVQD